MTFPQRTKKLHISGVALNSRLVITFAVSYRQSKYLSIALLLRGVSGLKWTHGSINLIKIIICDKKMAYMDFILRVVCSYNEQNKTYTPFSSYIIFIGNLSAILIGTIL